MSITQKFAHISCAVVGTLLATNTPIRASEPTRLVEVQAVEIRAVEIRAAEIGDVEAQADTVRNQTDRSQGQMDISQIKEALSRLLLLGFDVSRCGHHPAKGIFRLELGAGDDLGVLRNNGFDILSEQSSAGLRGNLTETAYFDPGEIQTLLDQVAADHPGITQVFTIGTTFEGRAIRAIEISNHPGVAEDKPAIQFNAQHHSREVATSHVVIDIVNQLTDQYGIDPTITAMVDNYKTVCVPMVNLDGVQFVFDSDNLWRKNRRLNVGCAGCSGTGVDPNRNYPYLWGPGCGSSGSCCSSIYRGASSASEQEVQAMIGLQDQYRFVIATSYHASGRFIDYPYACSDGSPSGQMPEHGIIDEMMNAMASAISSVDGVNYTAFTPVPIGGVNGDDTSWYYAHAGVYPFIVEVGTSFAPPFAEVANIIYRNRAGWEYLYDRMGQARINIRAVDHLTGAPLEAKIELLQQGGSNILFDTGELDRFSEPTFGRSRWMVEANDTYTMRVSKSGYQTRTVQIPVTNAPVDVAVLLLANGTTLGDEDQDGDIDLSDFARFQECFDPSPIQAGCRIFDMDANEAVTLEDLDEWITVLSGP